MILTLILTDIATTWAKKINHKFLRPIFSKINEAGRLYFLFFIASDQNEGFYFFPAKV